MAWALFCHDFDLSKGINILSEKCPVVLDHYKQRVALARSLAPKPKIILMDEPFSNLDATLKQSVRQEVKAILQAENMTSIIVTHDLQDTEALCDDTVVLA